MYNRLYEYLTKNNLLFDKQFEFKKGHSTEHALMELVNRIYDSFNENKYTLGVFIDLSKSFDTVKRSSHPEVFCIQVIFRNLAKFTGKHRCQSLCQSLRLWHMFFPVNFARSLLTPFFTELLRWLLNFKGDLSTRTCQTDFQPKTN